MKSSKTAVIIVGHGSRLKGFEKAMEKVAASLRKGRRFFLVQCAYLEITSPLISEAIDRCIQKGADEVRVLPYFLLMGNHVKFDIPAIIAGFRKKHRGKARVLLCPYLGFHEKIVAVVKERLQGVR